MITNKRVLKTKVTFVERFDKENRQTNQDEQMQYPNCRLATSFILVEQRSSVFIPVPEADCRIPVAVRGRVDGDHVIDVKAKNARDHDG